MDQVREPCRLTGEQTRDCPPLESISQVRQRLQEASLGHLCSFYQKLIKRLQTEWLVACSPNGDS